MGGDVGWANWRRRRVVIALEYFALVALCIFVFLLVGTSPERAVFGGTVVGGWLACILFSGVELLAPAAFLRWRERWMEGAPYYAQRAAAITDRYAFGKDPNHERPPVTRVRLNGLVLFVVATLISALLWLMFIWAGLL